MIYARGRFRAEGKRVRELADGTRIVFYDERKIYVFPRRGRGTVFHRWGAEKGFYFGSWKIFRQRLMTKVQLNYLLCFEIAATYDIPSLTVHKTIEEILNGEDENQEKK